MAQMTLERVGQPPTLPTVPRPHGGIWRIVREIALLAVLFGVYNLGRFLSAEHAGSAYRHADDLIRWENWLGLPSEVTVQQQVLRVHGLADVANVFYASVHFPLTAVVLLWLMIRRPVEYGKARWALASLTGLALIGHMFACRPRYIGTSRPQPSARVRQPSLPTRTAADDAGLGGHRRTARPVRLRSEQ